MHKIAQKSWSEGIFKAYDIRGRYPEEINEDAAYKIARAFVRYLRIGNSDGKILKIVVSADARKSSPALKEAFLGGLLDEGAEIIDAGLTTTPMHYFIVNKTDADGGAMITASHIPPPANGIKLSKKWAVPIGQGFGMEEIKNDAIRGIFGAVVQQSGAARKTRVCRKEFLNDYIQFFVDKFPELKKYGVKIAACAGNGMTSILLKKLFEKFPKIKIELLHNDLDMTFPNHEANPLKFEMLRDVQELVKSGSLDLGLSFDGDGDRIGFVDEKGNIVPGDIMTALLLRRFVDVRGTIVYDLTSSRVISEEINKYGLHGVESPRGHTFFKQIMRKKNAVFGGEISGHYFFREFFGVESAAFAALALLSLMRAENKSLSALVKPLLRYAKSEELNFKIKDKEKILDKIAAFFSNGNISYLDGIKIDYPDWWFNLRPSNTEDLLRLNIEAKTPELLGEKKKLLEELLK